MKYILICIFITTSLLFSQNKIESYRLHSNFAKIESRKQFRTDLQKRINYIFSQNPNHNNEAVWIKLFKEVGLQLIRNDAIYSALTKASNYAPQSGIKFQRSVAEAIITLYPKEFSSTIDSFYVTTRDPTLFAYCTNYYLKGKFKKSKRLKETLKTRFPNWKNIPQLNFLVFNLNSTNTLTPPLQDILNHNFLDGKTIIYSLQRKDRRHPGITIIKKPNGEFVRDENDSIFFVKQLALSVTNLPGYLSQGNTPQGIFSVVGFYNSPTPSIGPTPAVLTRIPYEIPTKLWFHSSVKKSNWDVNDYKDLLPKSWQDYLPIYESFYAGKTGRRKIVMHGSVDDLSFYDSLSYAPLTPSLGCLTTTEIWSESTGKNIRSDQSKLINAFFSTGQLYGFLVVINIDDKKEDVTMDEILPFIQ